MWGGIGIKIISCADPGSRGGLFTCNKSKKMIKFILRYLFLLVLIKNKNIKEYLQVWGFVTTLLWVFGWPRKLVPEVVGYRRIWDLTRYRLILLSLWLVPLILQASYRIYKINYYKELFIGLIVMLGVALIMSFVSRDLLSFYIYFEASLIPTLLLILGWGVQPERAQAGVYLLFYTLFASLPLLICLIYIKGITCYLGIIIVMLNDVKVWYVYLGLILAFLVKIPVYMGHLWLPKAHVEAPVAGSIILAGVLLKLGGYGLLRVAKITEFYQLKYSYFWVGLSLLGCIYISLICLRQRDIKSLVAYSSVAHIGLVISGLMVGNNWGSTGGLIIILGHGLCSSGLFLLVNIVYERSGSRRLIINRGLINYAPNMALWWFIFSAINIAAPPSINLLGEIRLLVRLIRWRTGCIVFLGVISFFTAAYTLFIYSYRQHGQIRGIIFSITRGYTREYLTLLLHWVPLNLFIFSIRRFRLWIYLNSLIKILKCGFRDTSVLNNITKVKLFNFYQSRIYINWSRCYKAI